DAIMIGGSTGVTQNKVDATVLAVKEAAKVPVILFPASAANLSPHADALYFMSLLNSRDPRLIIGEQRLAAPVVRAWGLETIPMAYLVIEPGMRAGEVGDAELISRKNPTVAVQYALAAQLLGMKLVYLEAGSGAPEPVPDRMMRAVLPGRRPRQGVAREGCGGVPDCAAPLPLPASGADRPADRRLFAHGGLSPRLSIARREPRLARQRRRRGPRLPVRVRHGPAGEPARRPHVLPPLVPALVRRLDPARGVPTRRGRRPDDLHGCLQRLLPGPDRPRDDLGIRGRPLGPRGHPVRDLE